MSFWCVIVMYLSAFIHRPKPWFNIKMPSHQYMKSHCGDKTVVRSSYLHNGISYTGKMIFLYFLELACEQYLLDDCRYSGSHHMILNDVILDCTQEEVAAQVFDVPRSSYNCGLWLGMFCSKIRFFFHWTGHKANTDQTMNKIICYIDPTLLEKHD